jgi:hypothetical protein
MKKIFVITLLLISVNTFAADPVSPRGTNPGNINQSGTNPANIMLGAGDGAISTGLGNKSGSELNRSSPFSSSNSSVPKVSLAGLVAWLASIMNQLIYLILGASLVVFLYGIFKLAFVDGLKPESREQARKFMFWGIVSLFVMVSVWGLVNILKVSLFGNGPLIIPQFK